MTPIDIMFFSFGDILIGVYCRYTCTAPGFAVIFHIYVNIFIV